MIRYRGSFSSSARRKCRNADKYIGTDGLCGWKGAGGNLYKNEELDCYIWDVTAADGKETQNTGKRKSEDAAQRRNLHEFNVISTEWGISLTSTRIDGKSNEIPQMQEVKECFACEELLEKIMEKEGQYFKWKRKPMKRS